MNNNVNYIESAYIALELTKLNDDNAVDKYLDNLSKLTGIENLSYVDNLVEQNEKLKQKYNDLLNEKKYSIGYDDLINLIDYVKKQSGLNMEPDVAEIIISELEKCI